MNVLYISPPMKGQKIDKVELSYQGLQFISFDTKKIASGFTERNLPLANFIECQMCISSWWQEEVNWKSRYEVYMSKRFKFSSSPYVLPWCCSSKHQNKSSHFCKGHVRSRNSWKPYDKNSMSLHNY